MHANQARVVPAHQARVVPALRAQSGRAALQPFVGLALCVLQAACSSPPPGYLLETPHGATFSGTNIGRVVRVSGLAGTPGAEIELCIRDPSDEAPGDLEAGWEVAATTFAGIDPVAGTPSGVSLSLEEGLEVSVGGSAGELSRYPWALEAVLVPDWREVGRWPEGAVAQVRLKEDGIDLAFYGDLEASLEDPTGAYATDNALRPEQVITLVSTSILPDPAEPALSRPSGHTASQEETDAYYEAIGAGPGALRETLSGWRQANGFPKGDVTARYFNAEDLGFGREMHCRATATDPTNGIACYVVNYGQPGDPPKAALSDLLEQRDPVATVAMEYAPADPTNPVRFYAYGSAGQLLREVQLDREGPKATPQACLSCHGGSYDPLRHRIDGASFLPFDPYAYLYADSSNASREAQQEAFRQLNVLVKATAPQTGILARIDAQYAPPGVGTAGTVARRDVVPAGWAGSEQLYLEVARPYCMGCHMARPGVLGFPDTASFYAMADPILGEVCRDHTMPHGQIARERFWQSPARALLLRALGRIEGCTPGR